MKIWIFTTKDADELRQLEDNDFIKMASPKDVNIGDIIIVYSQINNNIKYILEAQRKAYKDKNFRPPWEIFVDLSNKIELMDPLERDEIENDSQLESWSFVKGNFGDIFTEVPPKSWEPLKNLILNKNPSNSEYINHLMINKWFFAIQDSFYEELKMSNEIIWHSPDDIKKEDIIFVYTASPKSSVVLF